MENGKCKILIHNKTNGYVKCRLKTRNVGIKKNELSIFYLFLYSWHVSRYILDYITKEVDSIH